VVGGVHNCRNQRGGDAVGAGGGRKHRSQIERVDQRWRREPGAGAGILGILGSLPSPRHICDVGGILRFARPQLDRDILRFAPHQLDRVRHALGV
jgi:hypothetical protein